MRLEHRKLIDTFIDPRLDDNTTICFFVLQLIRDDRVQKKEEGDVCGGRSNRIITSIVILFSVYVCGGVLWHSLFLRSINITVNVEVIYMLFVMSSLTSTNNVLEKNPVCAK